MTPRDNLLSLYRRRGYSNAPVCFGLCPSLVAEFKRRHGDAIGYQQHFGFPEDGVYVAPEQAPAFDQQRWFPGETFKPGTAFDDWGVGHEPGSEAAHHMTRMLHPLAHLNTIADLDRFPFPEWCAEVPAKLIANVAALQAAGKAVSGHMAMTVWETAWYMRGMDRLVADFAEEPEFAESLLDRITDRAVLRAQLYAKAGCDILALGDDVGTQSRLMMSPNTYRRWLKPRLTRVIAAARAEKPDILVLYHTCGHVTGLIPDLIEAGIDVLNPVQPESMDFPTLHREYGADLSFNGVIGTQSVMPFGTPDEVRQAVRSSLDLAGARGGLFACPTHLLEPEVPWENIEAYAEACHSYQG